MNNYVIIAIGWFLGQLGYAAVSAYIIQRKVPGIDYPKALRLYFKNEVGSFAMAFAALLVVMFIIPDFIDVKVTRADLLDKEKLTLKEKIVVFFRTASVAFGAFCQHLIYLAFRKGKRAIEEYAEKNNIE
jgi:hypothetical protein